MVKKAAVERVIKGCMGYRKGETLLIVTDDELEGLAKPFFEKATSIGIEATLMLMKQRKVHGEEPPRAIAHALREVDIALLITKKSLSHTMARREACRRWGTRIASMPDITLEIINRSLDIDYEDLRKRAQDLAKIFSQGKTARVTTKMGTDLTISIVERKGFKDTGLYTKKGAFGNLPAGEVCIAPVEGSAQGIVVLDASMTGIGRLTKPVRLIIEDGNVTDISSKKLIRLIKPLGRSALNVAELGIGLNPKAKVTGNVLEDEKAIGTGHIALGDNISFGGKVEAPCHLDGVFFDPTIIVDGKEIEVNL